MANKISNYGEGFLDPVREIRKPLATDNTYQVGQPWIDTVADRGYELLDVTAGVAIWGLTSTTGGGSLPYTTALNPAIDAAVTTAIIDVWGGTVITLTAAGNSQTLASPTDTTPGREFVAGNASASTHTIDVNGVVLQPGESQKYVWDGTAWTLGTGIDADHVDFVPEKWMTAVKVQAALIEILTGRTQELLISTVLTDDYSIYKSNSATPVVHTLPAITAGMLGIKYTWMNINVAPSTWSTATDTIIGVGALVTFGTGSVTAIPVEISVGVYGWML